MSTLSRQDEMFATFWDFLTYLDKYVAVVNLLDPVETDPARTVLLSKLVEYMRPVLRADVTFVGFCNLENTSSDRLHVVKESLKIRPGIQAEQPALVKRLEGLKWHFPCREVDFVQVDQPEVLFDAGLERLPRFLREVVTALAISRVELFGREYFLFFCDVEPRAVSGPRYTGFDKAMLKVAAGLLATGFRSGVRKGRKVQQDFEEEQTRQFLVDLVHELKTPIQGVLADASNLQAEMPPELSDLQELATRNLNTAYHLSWLVDTIRMTLVGRDLPDETLVRGTLEKPLAEAFAMFVGEARAKGLQLLPIRTLDGEPFPSLPMYPNQLTVAFKNLIHNAIVYSLPDDGGYQPVEIVGQRVGEACYAIDITNYGLEITQEEIEQGKLFKLRYRGKQARRLVASGSGLGLTSAQRIVDKHGGKIEITSEPVTPPLFRNTFRVALLMLGPK
jgi:signal transduction histidine kinase